MANSFREHFSPTVDPKFVPQITRLRQLLLLLLVLKSRLLHLFLVDKLSISPVTKKGSILVLELVTPLRGELELAKLE
jgi:hypothetical protein